MIKLNKIKSAQTGGREQVRRKIGSLARDAPGGLLRLKIILMGSNPAIWREIIVPQNYSFFDLNVAIQDVFEWEDSHLHQFFTMNPYKARPPYPRIAIPHSEYDDGEDTIDERTAKIKEYLNKIGAKVYYEYDFGDSWMHEVEIIEILENNSTIKFPAIIGGENAAPPEDCGGIGGYYDLIEAIKNPKNPSHKDMMEWLGVEKPSDFDPVKFDIRDVKFHDPKKVLARYEKFR